MGTQPDGSWIGEEHGTRFHLDSDQNAAADRFLAGAGRAEHEISPQINQITHGIDGAQMRGYPDFVLKSEDSLKRKLATDLLDNPALTTDEAIAGLRDSVRYTIEVPAHNYSDGVLHAVNDLRARGFENVTFKPTWDVPDSYKGVNSTWRDPATGRVFELQFHTPDSFAAKMTTHDLYEAQRLPGVSEAEVARLKAEQGEIFRRVGVPADTQRLTELRNELNADRAPAMAAAHSGHGGVHGEHSPAQPGEHAGQHASGGDAHGGPVDDGHTTSDASASLSSSEGGAIPGHSDAGLPPNGGDPFDTLSPAHKTELVDALVADSNDAFPLTPENAEAVLRNGPHGTVPHVAGEGGSGADVSFVDDNGDILLQRENKSIAGGYNSFNSELKHAIDRQINYDGEVWVQVRPETDVDNWIRKWQGVRSDTRLLDYRQVEVVFRDGYGQDLGRYNLGDRLPPE